jgi:DNA-binding NtrC family response regulator
VTHPLLNGRSILIVEDEPLVALDIETALKDAGASVTIAQSARQALGAVEADGLSAAVLDHRLGDGDSDELRKRLKARGVPFLVYSGYPDIGGTADIVVVSKPAKTETLLLVLEKLLRDRPS